MRQEWATDHGLPAITSERFTAALDAVCTRLGVHSGMADKRAEGILTTPHTDHGALYNIFAPMIDSNSDHNV